jgi:hypothetical protein
VGATEHRTEVDANTLVERLRIHVLDRGSRAGHTDVVDEHVEAAKRVTHVGEQVVDRRSVGDVGDEIG